MAMAHGFRVYVVEAYRNRKKDRDPQPVQVNSETVLEIRKLLDQIHARGTIYLEPPPVAADSDEPQKRTTTFTLDDPILVRDDFVHVRVYQGEVGERPFARHPQQQSQPLDEWSTEAPYYMGILFPTVEDNRFIIVAQVIHRRDAIPLFLRILRMQSAENKKQAIEAEKAARLAAREAKETLPAKQEHWKLLFERHQASDNAYLDDIIKSAKTATAEFESKVPSPRGGEAMSTRRKLRISLLDDDDKEISSVIGRRWADRFRRGESEGKAAGVSELAALLEEHDLMDDGEAEAYNEAGVTLDGGISGRTRITTDALKDVFTYGVSEGPPSEYHHYKKVSSRLEVIAAEEELELGVIDALEVDQCLPD